MNVTQRTERLFQCRPFQGSDEYPDAVLSKEAANEYSNQCRPPAERIDDIPVPPILKKTMTAPTPTFEKSDEYSNAALPKNKKSYIYIYIFQCSSSQTNCDE